MELKKNSWLISLGPQRVCLEEPRLPEELYAAVKIAEKAAELITAVDEYFGYSEEPEAEDEPAEPAEAEEKPNAKKGAVKETVLEADDLGGILEWLKGELENLEDESDD